ncbi:putative aquaporin-3 [Friedmanniomyces endolithicus]|nr:putative aquaporin-3 [Friedmanniomyces endolithicus]
MKNDAKSSGPSLDQPMFGLIPIKDSNSQTAFQGHMIAATGEFVGTFLFLFFGFIGHLMAVDTAPNSGKNGVNSNQTVIYIALSYGLSLLVTVWTLFRISGGLFNPAVTLAMVVTGSVPPVRGLILFLPQMLAGICAAAVASVIVPGDIRTVQTTLTPGMSPAQGVFLEMFLTAQLCFTALMLAAEKSKDTFIAPIGIGLAFFVCEIAGVFYTGASLNPTRSFGPAVVGRDFHTYHWIYWIGPFLGALLAAGYFHFVKFFNYEEANPGQDSAGGQFDREVEEQAASPGAERDSMNMDDMMEGGNAGKRSRAGTGQGQGQVPQGQMGQGQQGLGLQGQNGGYHPGYAGQRM